MFLTQYRDSLVNSHSGGREGYRFLIIGEMRYDPWRQMCAEALVSLGSLEVIGEIDALAEIRQKDYDVIIIDAAQVQQVLYLVSSIRTQQPEAKILVVTASPTWKRARQAFRAGATDYMRKSRDQAEILSALQAVLDRKPIPRGGLSEDNSAGEITGFYTEIRMKPLRG